MTSWIDLGALGHLLVVGLLCGAGLPALFALGVRVLNRPAHPGVAAGEPAPTAAGGAAAPALTEVRARPTVASFLVAGLCFAVVAAAIGLGIGFLVTRS